MAPDASAPEFLPGTRIGQYEILGVLGRGGMGTVYEGVHPQIGKRVAIKVLARHHARDAEFSVRFQREAEVVNRIGHPGLIDVFSFGQLPDGHLYLVMELLVGEHLAARIERGPFTWSELYSIASQILDAIQAAHDAGVIHRDLKPENIFLLGDRSEEAPRVKVLDFGLAKVIGGELTHTGIALGTPRYMAPEQVKGKQVDPRTDIYAMGLILYEAVTGRFPFSAFSPLEMLTLQLMEPPPPPSSFAMLPLALESVILKALEKDPENRFQSAREMQDALRQIAPPDLHLDLRRSSSTPKAPLGYPRDGFNGQVQFPMPEMLASQVTPAVKPPKWIPPRSTKTPPPLPPPQAHPGLPHPEHLDFTAPAPLSPPETLELPPQPAPERERTPDPVAVQSYVAQPAQENDAAISASQRLRTVIASSVLVLFGVIIGASLQPSLSWLESRGRGAQVTPMVPEPVPPPPPKDVPVAQKDPPIEVTPVPVAEAAVPALAPKTGTLEIHCESSSALIKVDGVRRREGCQTPITNLPPGRHKVTVATPGSPKFRKRISIEAGATVVLRMPSNRSKADAR